MTIKRTFQNSFYVLVLLSRTLSVSKSAKYCSFVSNFIPSREQTKANRSTQSAEHGERNITTLKRVEPASPAPVGKCIEYGVLRLQIFNRCFPSIRIHSIYHFYEPALSMCTSFLQNGRSRAHSAEQLPPLGSKQSPFLTIYDH